MRLPFLQIDQDALIRARTLAGLLAIPAAHGIGLAVSLFAWALDMAPDGDLSGHIRDANPAEMVAAGVGWTGDSQRLYLALQRVGFIEVAAMANACDRIRGLSRYEAATTTKAARSEAGRKGAAARWGKRGEAPQPMANACDSDAIRMANDAQTQTQTQILKAQAGVRAPEPDTPPPVEPTAPVQAELLPPGAGDRRQPDSPGAAFRRKRGQPKAKPVRHAALRLAVSEAFQESRGSCYGFLPKDDAPLDRLTAIATQEDILGRWRIGLAQPEGKWQRCSSVAELERKWNELAGVGRRVESAPASRAACPVTPAQAAHAELLEQVVSGGAPYAAQQLELLLATALDDGVLLLEAPDRFRRDHCRRLLDELAARARGPVRQVRIVAPSAEERAA